MTEEPATAMTSATLLAGSTGTPTIAGMADTGIDRIL